MRHGKDSEGLGVEVCVDGALTGKESSWSSVKCVRFECGRNRSKADDEREPGCCVPVPSEDEDDDAAGAEQPKQERTEQKKGVKEIVSGLEEGRSRRERKKKKE